MAHGDLVRTIEAHVRANFSACEILVENDGREVPAEGVAFLTIGFPWAREERITVDEVDEGEFVQEGAFTLTLALPRGQGSHEGRDWLDGLARLFRGKHVGRVRCGAPAPPVPDRGDGRSGHFELILAVPYTFYTVD